MALKKIIGQRELDVSIPQGSTVMDLLVWMKERWGDKLWSHLFESESDRLLPHIRLMINGRSIEFLKGLDTLLQEGDEFLILPIVAGG